MELTPQLLALKAAAKKIPDNYGLVTSMEEATSIRDMLLASNSPIAFDIETGYTGPDLAKHSLNMFSPKQFISGFSITNDPRWARYIPLRHDFYEGNLPEVDIWELFRPVFETKHIICHNVAFEGLNLRMLSEKLGIAPIEMPHVTDTMILSYVLAATMYHGLKEITKVHFEHQMTHITDLFPKMTQPQQEALRFNVLDLTPEVVNYACEDSKWTLLLYMLLNGAMELEDLPLRTIYNDMECQITPILMDMRESGVTVDWDTFDKSYEEFFRFDHNMDSYVRHLFSEAVGRDISDVNFKSTKQMRALLFEEMGLKSERMTKSGALSTDETTLLLLAQQHPAPSALIRHRQTNKNGGFLKTWKNYEGNPHNLIHPVLNQVRVGSGRFACADPNVQNITKDWFYSTTEAGPFGDTDNKLYQAYAMTREPGSYWTGNARNFLVAREGYTFLSYDVSQGELRVLAGLADEPYLKQAFEDKVDIHSATAAQMFKIPLSKVTPALRARGKAQPLDSKVLTPSGWRIFGDLKVGDSVIGSDGNPTEITGIFPQGVKDVYRLTTTDGGSTECCDEHLWTVLNVNSKTKKWKTYPLKKLMRKSLKAGGGYKWRLPNRPVANFAPQDDLPIDPYILGLLLGDGTFRHGTPSFSSADRELIEAMKAWHEGNGGSVTEVQVREGFWSLYLKYDLYRNPLTTILRELDLWKKRDSTKFIPAQYMTASPEDRLALLQGLLDTDGNVLASGAEFKVTSKHLVLQAQELARSLGGFASFNSIGVGSPSTKKDGGAITPSQEQWHTYLRLPLGTTPFRLERKSQSLKRVVNRTSPSIKSIEYSRKAETQCISVSASDGLYVTEDYLVTHNTINFGLIYGQGVKAMAESLKISIAEAKSLQSAYFSAFSNVNNWIARQIVDGRRNGYTRTFMGRKVTIWELQSDNPAIQQKGERLLINVPVQGGLADIVKMSMINCANILKEAGLWGDKVYMVMNQHDSLVFEVHNSLDLRDIQAMLLPGVEFPIDGFPTFISDWSYGTKYGEMTDFKYYGQDIQKKPKVLNLEMSLSTAREGSIDTIKSVLGDGDDWLVNLTFPEQSADQHPLGYTSSRNLLTLAEIQGVELSVPGK